MNILQISTYDICGGAEKIAWSLHDSYKNRGYAAWLAVGYKKSEDSNILLIPNDIYRSRWWKLWRKIGNRLVSMGNKIRGIDRLGNFLRYQVAQPQRWLYKKLGYEDYNFPASQYLLSLPPQKPDILHCHNLHGDYFDLKSLSYLSRKVPVLLTLHDAWLLGGHCSHSFDCERWKIGCGQCPDLTIYPPIKKDAAAYNWQRKRNIYKKSKLYLATPSHWLMQKVKQSILSQAIIESRIIPNGVDLSVFKPYDKQSSRKELSISEEAKVILFTANGIYKNPFKDYLTLRHAVDILAHNVQDYKLVLIALGEDRHTEQIGKVKIEFVPFQKNPLTVARYYQSADIYVHAAKAETFPNTILESLACGTPVIATAVGGIPEQIEDRKTGFLVPPGNAESMATAVQNLLRDEELRQRMGIQAAESARRFSLERMTDDYLEWYQEILERYYEGRYKRGL